MSTIMGLVLVVDRKQNKKKAKLFVDMQLVYSTPTANMAVVEADNVLDGPASSAPRKKAHRSKI